MLILLSYVLCRLPDVFFLRGFPAAVFPLNSLYMSRLLLAGHPFNADLAKTVISASDTIYIYPPGLYFFASALRSVQNMFIFLCIVQSAVPILVYFLFRRLVQPLQALFASLAAVRLCTNVQWWAPDYIVQPLLLLAVLLLMARGAENRYSLWGYLGLLNGIVIIFKHNIGIFFGIALGTYLFLNSLEQHVHPGFWNRFGVFFPLAGFFMFGVYFTIKLIHTDELVFYVLPYVAFWSMIAIRLANYSTVCLDVRQFLQRASLFSLASLLLPALIFLEMGRAVGFRRYWYSLFGMGLKHLKLWDSGIFAAALQYVHALRGSLAYGVETAFFLSLFLFPLAVNVMSIQRLRRQRRTNDSILFFKTAAVCSLGIMGIFCFFPLEGYHILSSKLLLFGYIAAFLIAPSRKATTMGNRLLRTGSLALVALSMVKPYRDYLERSDYVFMSAPFNLKVKKTLASAANEQLDVLSKTVRDRPYYIIDSSGMTLMPLLARLDNRTPEYYLEMRPGVLEPEVSKAILESVDKTPFVVVNADDYDRYQRHTIQDPEMGAILNHIGEHYSLVASYSSPAESAQILSYVIMKKRADV